VLLREDRFRGSGCRRWRSGTRGSAGASSQAGAGADAHQNQLHALALSQGVQKKRKLWTEAGRAELEKLELLPYAAIRRAAAGNTRPLEQKIAALNRQWRPKSSNGRRRCA